MSKDLVSVPEGEFLVNWKDKPYTAEGEEVPSVVSREECSRLLLVYVGKMMSDADCPALRRLRARIADESIEATECIRIYGDPIDWPEAS